MDNSIFNRGSLVLYKNQPARILHTTEKKIEIETIGGQSYNVRAKDIMLLHPGPIDRLGELTQQTGELLEAWALLAGEESTLSEVAELVYDVFTPATAWATWQHVEDGLYFSGTPENITVHDEKAVEKIKTTRAAKAAEAQSWSAFLSRVESGTYIQEDNRYLQDVIALAREESGMSRVLRALGRTQNSHNAHDLLLKIGVWDEMVNPYPYRFMVNTHEPADEIAADIGELRDEVRKDLTHLNAYAIDDAGSKDPDDAISLDNGRLWVHIADVSALVSPDSLADKEARARTSNLYLPEGTVHMLPIKATQLLGLGLQEISPAFSFGIDLNDSGEIEDVEIVPSWVRVTRMSYDTAEGEVDGELLGSLYQLARRYENRRLNNGAITINLPEVKVLVRDNRVEITPLPSLRSRDLVRESMLAAGEAVAKFALQHDIPVPFSTQDAPDTEPDMSSAEGLPYSLSAMFALRRTLRASAQKSVPGPHAGLGMPMYTQATSPLRRYLDLVIHQQLRAFLRGEPLLNEQSIIQRVGTASATIGGLRQTERASTLHWKLVYLNQNPHWQGEGVVVEKRGTRNLVVIPDLAMETNVYTKQDLPLDSVINLKVRDVNLPEQEAHFQIL